MGTPLRVVGCRSLNVIRSRLSLSIEDASRARADLTAATSVLVPSIRAARFSSGFRDSRTSCGLVINLPDGQITPSTGLGRVQPHLQKYFCFSEFQIRLYNSLSRPIEGRLAIVTAAGRDAVDA